MPGDMACASIHLPMGIITVVMLVRVEFLLLRILAHHPAIKVASDEVANDDADIK